MFGLIKKILIGLLTVLINGSNHTKRVQLTNQKCMIQPALINLHPNKHNQDFASIHLQLNQINVLEVAILRVLAYLIKYVFQTKEKI